MARKKVIVDTGVLSRAIANRDTIPTLFSVVRQLLTSEDYTLCITVPIAMELQQWMRFAYKKSDTRRVEAALELIRQCELLPFTREAQKHAIELSKRYSIGGISDLMTAAVATTEKVEVFTLNRKDFMHIQGVQLYTPANWPEIIKEL